MPRPCSELRAKLGPEYSFPDSQLHTFYCPTELLAHSKKKKSRVCECLWSRKSQFPCQAQLSRSTYPSHFYLGHVHTFLLPSSEFTSGWPGLLFSHNQDGKTVLHIERFHSTFQCRYTFSRLEFGFTGRSLVPI